MRNGAVQNSRGDSGTYSNESKPAGMAKTCDARVRNERGGYIVHNCNGDAMQMLVYCATQIERGGVLPENRSGTQDSVRYGRLERRPSRSQLRGLVAPISGNGRMISPWSLCTPQFRPRYRRPSPGHGTTINRWNPLDVGKSPLAG